MITDAAKSILAQHLVSTFTRANVGTGGDGSSPSQTTLDVPLLGGSGSAHGVSISSVKSGENVVDFKITIQGSDSNITQRTLREICITDETSDNSLMRIPFEGIGPTSASEEIEFFIAKSRLINMADNEYINSGYITKMGDNSTHNGNAGQPVDGVDFPHSGLIKALNAMATTGYAGLTASVGTGSKNFNMQMNDSSGQTVITVRTGKVIRGGVLMGATTEATITEIVHTGSMTDTTEQFQKVTADDPGANRYHLIVVDSTNAVKIRQSPGVDKVADLNNGDIPIAVLRIQRGEAKATRHIQYLTSSETTGTDNFC